ncbi:MAG: hypothetical protein ACRCZF_23090, partial [Gemmataceae bacterium]
MAREWNQLFRSIVPAGTLGVAILSLTPSEATAFFPPLGRPDQVIVVPPSPPVVIPPVVVPPVV